MSELSVQNAVSLESLVAQVADEFRERQARGERPDPEEYAARHPEAAELLRKVLAALDVLALSLAGGVPAGDASCEEPVAGVLGDFRIIRELGRGGMGVVYEAEQVSLGRRVALKVLPLAATMDPRRLQRFINEAKAAACLHHTNIVPVFAVGSERGVHFYAMQLIEGVTLAALVRDLRQAEQPVQRSRIRQNAGKAGAQPDQGSRIRQNAGTPNPHSGECGYGQHEEPKTAPYGPPVAAVTTAPVAALSTIKTGRDAAYYRKVAEMGAKAAEALDYAHQMGVVHRDIKPGNLMLDGRGDVWITDFGLAQLQSEAGLTLTGDLVGTLRYMSPEQALAKRVVIDHRTDVYSLGATLYELLTLRPVFEGADRQELLRQIAFGEPRRPRQWDRAIPQELDTIVLKAMERNPADRYATSQELADDLKRYVEDKPIRARRPTVRQRLGRWGRRHPGWTGTMGLVAGILLAGAWAWDRETTQAETRAQTVAAEADQLRDTDRLPEALLAARRAADLLPRFSGDVRLRRKIEQRVADLQLLNRLEEARMEAAAVRADGEGFDDIRSSLLFRQAFKDFGVDVTAGDEADVIGALWGRALESQIFAALCEWAYRAPDLAERQRLFRLADALDPDSRRLFSRAREAAQANDVNSLKRLAAEALAEFPPPPILTRLAMTLVAVSLSTDAERLLRAGHLRYPADFWINHDLGIVLLKIEPDRRAEAVRYFSAALALRPRSPAVWSNLGNALLNAGRHQEAVAAYRKAIELKPDIAEVHGNLGNALHEQGKLEEAVAACRMAIKLKPDLAEAHSNLGIALCGQGRLEEAVAASRMAIKLKPDLATAHSNLGAALHEQGKLEEAVTAFRKVIELEPDLAGAYNNLGSALREQGKLKEAVAACRMAIKLKPDLAAAHNSLGSALCAQGKPEEAVAAYRKAIELKPDLAEAHSNLGIALRELGKLEEAVTACRKAIELKPDLAFAHLILGYALFSQGKLAEAVAAYRKGITLKPDLAQAHNNNLRITLKLARLQERLPAVLQGKDHPKDASERLAFADLCQRPFIRQYAAAARFFAEAFAEQPALAADSQTANRYNAACAAALAGCGQGKDAAGLSEKERARLRQHALDWLRADLDAWNGLLKKEPDKVRPVLIQQMQHWQADTDFAGVRGTQALAKLPEGERAGWQKLWADVADTLARAKGEPPVK